ncbi:alpha-taxilin isoform X1 [Tachysurus fulvidraco]|uniref:alpha-taxilin isoform X1 n=1 Tax=Tachysurus fulvidraco TaxID=1234273 RepID=UPI001FF0399D|nr:alpha-taxilin isoform X1 [Tachysurus fulvidraco]
MESSSQASDSGEKVNSVEEKPVNPMEVFSKQLEDIINTFGSASSLLEEKISSLEKDEENLEEKTTDANTVLSNNPETEQTASGLLEGLSKEASPLLQSLKTLMSPEEKVEMVLSKYGELLKEQKSEQVQLKMLQKKQGLLVKQRDQLQLEHSRGILARSRLEILCRDLYEHTKTLKEEMLLKCQEDEKMRAEIHSQFQGTVLEIQAQIEQHSNCNNKLSQENSDLTNKLTSILQKYERREETLEKIFKHRDLQQELSDAKLEEANLRLKEAEEKHKREKEYLLKEAIDKTKKCFTMKEQELQMKKQLVLYSQKFDEFQATLSKSNDVYAVFKQDMEKMNKKMTKLEKEGNMWKIRFENCNKALTEMIDERSEKGKQMELFTVKIDKLQTLCRALQEERKILYDKIKEIRLQTAPASAPIEDITEEEIPDLAQLSVLEPENNPALTPEMEKLWKEQARLKEFAALLMASTTKDTDSSNSDEELSEPKQTAQLTPLVPVPNKTIQSNQQEEEPTKAEPPKAEPPKEETPKVEPPKSEPPKEEPPKVEPPKSEPPKEEPPKVEPPKEEPPKAEPPKVEPPKVEPPKEEPPKAEPPKVEPPKAEPPKVEPPKAEPPKEEPPKAETPKEEPPKAEPPKEEPPKVELPKAEPPKEEPPKAEPPKAEPCKEQPPKVELPKAEPPNAESHKEKLAKVPKKNVAKVEPIQQNTHPQKSNKPNSVEQKEPQPKEMKTVRAQAEAPQVNSSKNELHTEQDPKDESTKEALVAETEPIKSEPPEASTAGAAKPQNCKCSESKASANKAHSKKPSSSKKKAATKATKKSC